MNTNTEVSTFSRIPRTLPVLHVDNIVMFPYIILPLIVSDELSKQVIDFALSNDRLLGLFLTKEQSEKDPIKIYDHGTAVSIIKMFRTPEGSISLLLQGVSRIKVETITQSEPFIKVEVEIIPESADENAGLTALKNISIELLGKLISESEEMNKEFVYGLKNIKQASRVADLIAGNLNFTIEEKQQILETIELEKRFKKLNGFLANLIKQLRIENTIRNRIQLEMDEDQRRYYLREQLDAIKKELGETDEVDQEIDKWERLIDEKDLPDYVKDEAEEELNRMKMMSPASSEYAVSRNYMEWLINIPWKIYSEDQLDLKRIETVLAGDHYGLETAKERIIEYIAVKKLRNKLKGPILCFVGPPGVGKTSLGKSVASSLNRKFIRLSLGGIHDEAEIRGHRKTYIGAMPGKIITEIKRCGTANPVFMLDEIDKLGRDFRGDPASALLEVLDPEQNNSFVDNYINLPFDLSEVMFITTANGLDTVPMALRDRMEIIEFSSYIEEEKITIAQKYLIPKEAENNGVNGKNVIIRKSALEEIIRYYVRESGVRNLQRNIGTIMRKVARKVAEGDTGKITVTDKNVKIFLKKRKHSIEMANRVPEIGVVTGLAWTIFGGEILFCETTLLPGKGKFVLTGLLGEVMQESAKLAYSLIKAKHKEFGIDPALFENRDLHIHLPAGAVPKDGPSAGVTLTTSLVSAFTQKKVKHNVAMTGEITLLGKVLPIGGVREKFLAAKRAGVKKVILPYENQDSYEEIPEKVKGGVDVMFVKDIQEILQEVLIGESD
ncbi:MAG: endopeptidase La [Candidatus Cloacimonetes bacterium]|nr:endopeptidase La [Candidatus Cloacimonadota bacterium]